MALRLDLIRTDGGTQTRAEVREDVVREYADAMTDGATFPAVTVFYDGSEYWLADGFHRYAAARLLNWLEIDADVRQGTLQDAQWHSLGANKAHGLRRTRADVERAIKFALLHPEVIPSGENSNRGIAAHIGTSHPTVQKYREELEATGKIYQSTERAGRDGRTINTANIGKRPAPPPPAPAPAFPPHNPETGELVERDGVPIPARVPAEVWQAAQRPVPQETAYTRFEDAMREAGESPRAQELHRLLSRLLEFERDGAALLATPYARVIGLHRAAREAFDLLEHWLVTAHQQDERVITVEAGA